MPHVPNMPLPAEGIHLHVSVIRGAPANLGLAIRLKLRGWRCTARRMPFSTHRVQLGICGELVLELFDIHSFKKNCFAAIDWPGQVLLP